METGVTRLAEALSLQRLITDSLIVWLDKQISKHVNQNNHNENDQTISYTALSICSSIYVLVRISDQQRATGRGDLYAGHDHGKQRPNESRRLPL